MIATHFEHLLKDNGSQFSRKNEAMRRYCECFVKKKHIWTSIHHPQIMGKLSAYQKGLKRFLFHKLERSRYQEWINQWIPVYYHWYNTGKYHSRIDTI